MRWPGNRKNIVSCQQGLRLFFPFLFFLVLAFAFSFPLLRDLYQSCRSDWDYFFFLYEIPSISLYEYSQLPLWNPYSGGGMPFIGNPQAGFPSPIFFITSIFGAIAGLKIAVWLHTFVGLWGMWLLSGYLGIRGPARLAPSFIFMFSGCWVLHLSEGHITWLPAAFLPFLFVSFIKSLDDKKWLFAAAIVQSIMVYEGGTYVVVFSILFIFIYLVCVSVEKQSLKPILSFFMVNILSTVFSAPKLLPTIELLHIIPRFTRTGSFLSWDNYLGNFLERGTSLDMGVVENNCYLGLIVVALYLVGVVRCKKHWPLAVASLFMLLITLGNFAWFSPWNILHGLPVFASMHSPSRALIVFSFSVALFVGMYLGEAGSTNSRPTKFLIAIIVLFIGYDLFTSNSPLFKEAVKPFWVFSMRMNGPTHLPYPPTVYHLTRTETTGLCHSVKSTHNPFTQIRVPDLERFAHGAWSDQYLPLLQNRGVVDAYEPIPIANYAKAVTDKEYKGESYLLGKGEASLLYWSPNRLSFHVRMPGKGLLVFNQNFFQGWNTSHGEVLRYKGLLAVDLPPGEYNMKIYYLPETFRYGVIIFLVTVVGCVVSCFIRVRQILASTISNAVGYCNR